VPLPKLAHEPRGSRENKQLILAILLPKLSPKLLILLLSFLLVFSMLVNPAVYSWSSYTDFASVCGAHTRTTRNLKKNKKRNTVFTGINVNVCTEKIAWSLNYFFMYVMKWFFYHCMDF
jgi:hypothetical protein